MQDFGGVRIEDDVLVTKDGCESFTDVPRTVDDIEQTMSGKSWPWEGLSGILECATEDQDPDIHLAQFESRQ